MKTLTFISLTAIAAGLLTIAGASAPVQAQEMELKASHHDAIGTPIHLGMNRLADLVHERSNGRIKIQLYPANQLGSEPQGVEGMSLGEIDIGAVVGATYGAFIEEANVLGMLYTFRDVDHMQKAMNGVLGDVLRDKLLEELNIRLLDGSWYFGTRQLTANKPINTPDDLVGLKLRVVPVPVYEVGWNQMGATATPIVGADLFSAIQTGVVDAQENPPPISKGYGNRLDLQHPDDACAASRFGCSSIRPCPSRSAAGSGGYRRCHRHVETQQSVPPRRLSLLLLRLLRRDRCQPLPPDPDLPRRSSREGRVRGKCDGGFRGRKRCVLVSDRRYVHLDGHRCDVRCRQASPRS